MKAKSKTTAAATNRRGNKPAKKPATEKPTAKAGTKTRAARTAKVKTVVVSSATEVKLSQMMAAQRVLAESGEPLNCKVMVEAMSAKGYWTSPGGKTPAATLYASLLRHIRQHGKAAKFIKTDRGLFAVASK